MQCGCNAGHTKESYAEAFRIIKSGPTLTLQNRPSFPLFHPLSYFFGLYNPETTYAPNYIIWTASVSSGRWSAPQRKCCFGQWSGQKSRFLPLFMVLWPSFPINTTPILHHFSHKPHPPSPPLPSTTMCFHRWPFIDCMNGQWGWNHAAKKCSSSGGHVGQSRSEVGLSRCKVDHHSLLFPRGPCALASIVFFFPSILFPSPLFLLHHWYSLPPSP